MHDIICPHCGESFIASDVTFDLSDYILPLLSKSPKEHDDVKNVGFKFYIDEDTIRNFSTSTERTPLTCEKHGGPDRGDSWFSFRITSELLRQYIEKNITAERPISEIINEIMNAQVSQKYTTGQEAFIRSIYYRFFSISRNGSVDFNMSDNNVQTVIRILIHIFLNSKLANAQREDTVTLQVRIGIHKSVPDILYIFENGTDIVRINKCCRYCGASLPTEFGCYKMMPIVLLGSHYSGKTSYLLSLLYTVLNCAPFVEDSAGHRSINVSTLTNDDDLVAFTKNIEQFAKGEAPDKTDFSNVPILNLLVNKNGNSIIYSFIDWPGELFINSELESKYDFIYHTRRVIFKARHFLCFLEPSQIDLNRIESEEHVRFDAADLVRSFANHIGFAEPDKLRSITYVINKIDLYEGDERNQVNPNAYDILTLANDKDDTYVYTGGKWLSDHYEIINDKAVTFLRTQNSGLFSGLMRIKEEEKRIERSFIPIAPYGKKSNTKDEGNQRVIHKNRFSGVPLLFMVERDRELMKKPI